MNIGVLTVRHPPSRQSPITPEVVALLEEWGARVEVIHPDEELTDLAAARAEHDLYILKAGTELALSYAGALDAVGAVILNPYPIAAMCRDKIVATRRLERAGVPVPATYTTLQPSRLAPLLDEGPLVVKPYRGSEGRGVHVNVSGAGVTAHAPNRDNAIRLIEFLSGDEAQQLFAMPDMNPYCGTTSGSKPAIIPICGGPRRTRTVATISSALTEASSTPNARSRMSRPSAPDDGATRSRT
jgi:hypothetical protein